MGDMSLCSWFQSFVYFPDISVHSLWIHWFPSENIPVGELAMVNCTPDIAVCFQIFLPPHC